MRAAAVLVIVAAALFSCSAAAKAEERIAAESAAAVRVANFTQAALLDLSVAAKGTGAAALPRLSAVRSLRRRRTAVHGAWAYLFRAAVGAEDHDFVVFEAADGALTAVATDEFPRPNAAAAAAANEIWAGHLPWDCAADAADGCA